MKKGECRDSLELFRMMGFFYFPGSTCIDLLRIGHLLRKTISYLAVLVPCTVLKGQPLLTMNVNFLLYTRDWNDFMWLKRKLDIYACHFSRLPTWTYPTSPSLRTESTHLKSSSVCCRAQYFSTFCDSPNKPKSRFMVDFFTAVSHIISPHPDMRSIGQYNVIPNMTITCRLKRLQLRFRLSKISDCNRFDLIRLLAKCHRSHFL